MGRLLKPGFGGGRVYVVVDLSEAERLFGPRASELVEGLVSSVRERCFAAFGLRALVEEGVSHYRVVAEAPPRLYGFVARAAEELELEVADRFGGVVHLVSMFFSAEPLEPFPVAVYRLETGVPESAVYRAVGLACLKLSLGGVCCAQLGRGLMGMPIEVGLSPPESVSVGTELGLLGFRLAEVRGVDLGDPRDRRFVQRLVDSAIRARFAEAGYSVDGLRFYERASLLDDPRVAVKPGVELQTFVYGDGLVAVAASPRFSVEARAPVSETGCKPGDRVRRVSDGLSGRVLEVIGGGRVRAELGGVPLEVGAEELVRIYGMGELEELGLAKRVLRITRMSAERWRSHVLRFLRVFSRVQVAGQVLEFSGSMAAVEAGGRG